MIDKNTSIEIVRAQRITQKDQLDLAYGSIGKIVISSKKSASESQPASHSTINQDELLPSKQVHLWRLPNRGRIIYFSISFRPGYFVGLKSD